MQLVYEPQPNYLQPSATSSLMTWINLGATVQTDRNFIVARAAIEMSALYNKADFGMHRGLDRFGREVA